MGCSFAIWDYLQRGAVFAPLFVYTMSREGMQACVACICIDEERLHIARI